MNVVGLLRGGLCALGEGASRLASEEGSRTGRIAPPSGVKVRLLLRGQRLFHPAVELLLMGFDPTINVTLYVCF